MPVGEAFSEPGIYINVSAPDIIETFGNGKYPVQRMPVSASAMDGTIIHGYRYSSGAQTADKAPNVPLLCLPSNTGNSREFHTLALALHKLKNGPRTIFTADMRGRGRSDRADDETYNPGVEAEDIISFCDAMGLHHIDVLATGGSAMSALLIAPKRPGLIQSVIFNDSGPERDGVGIARAKAIYQRMPEPSNWDEAIDVMQQAKATSFPTLSDADWSEMARTVFEESDGSLVRRHDPVFTGAESRIDFDERMPMFWPEFGIFKTKRILVLRGEHSLLMTQMLVDKMRKIAPTLQEIVVDGQGHPPMLGRHGLPKKINDFLNKTNS